MTETIPGCLGNFPKATDGNKCAFCDADLKIQCQIVTEKMKQAKESAVVHFNRNIQDKPKGNRKK